MSIARVGLSEHRKYAEGWEAIFGKKKASKNSSRNANAASKKSKKSRGKRTKK